VFTLLTYANIFQKVIEYFTRRTPNSYLEQRGKSFVWNYKYSGKYSTYIHGTSIDTNQKVYVSMFHANVPQMMILEETRQRICYNTWGRIHHQIEVLILFKADAQLRCALWESPRSALL
jgi:hypothetical protein